MKAPLLKFKKIFWWEQDDRWKGKTHMGDIDIFKKFVGEGYWISFHFKDYISLEAETVEAAKRIAQNVVQTKMMEQLEITHWQAEE